MGRIIVVLSNLPRLLRDVVVDAIQAEADIEIAGEAHSTEELRRLLRERSPDLVVAVDERNHLVSSRPDLWPGAELPKYLILSGDDGAASLHWMRPETSLLGQLTPDGLLRQIRSAARSSLG